jgi:SAM-dependent methyltransferase
VSKETWLHWYEGKKGKVEDSIPSLSELFRKINVSKILDLGCGTGRHCIHFAKEGFQVSGFDWSKVAIEKTRTALENENLFANLKVWDMLDFPYPYEDSFFDAVLSIKVVHHSKSDDIRKVIGEITRITKVDGILYLQVPMLEKVSRLSLEGVRSKEVESGTFLPLDGDEKGILHHYFGREELIRLLSDYRIVGLETREEHYCVTARKN